jgi:hypothetical protein
MIPPVWVDIDYDSKLTLAEQQVLKLPEKLEKLDEFMRKKVAPAWDRMLRKWWSSHGRATVMRQVASSSGRDAFVGFKKETTRWYPWAPRTARYRRAKGNEAKGILRDEDNLFKNVFAARKVLSKIAGGTRLNVIIEDEKAAFHQAGTSLMPERQVVPDPLPPQFEEDIRDMFRSFLKND